MLPPSPGGVHYTSRITLTGTRHSHCVQQTLERQRADLQVDTCVSLLRKHCTDRVFSPPPGLSSTSQLALLYERIFSTGASNGLFFAMRNQHCVGTVGIRFDAGLLLGARKTKKSRHLISELRQYRCNTLRRSHFLSGSRCIRVDNECQPIRSSSCCMKRISSAKKSIP